VDPTPYALLKIRPNSANAQWDLQVFQQPEKDASGFQMFVAQEVCALLD